MNRRDFTRAALAAVPTSLGYRAAFAQGTYPDKLITLIVAYAAGGSTDQRARQLGRFLGETFGQTVVVDNRPGAAGNIGTDAIARAKPDGYTIGMGNLGPLAVNPWLYRKLPFDPVNGLTKIALIERGPLMLVVKAESNYRSVPQLIAGSKVKPGGLSYGSSGAGSAHHLCGEMLKVATGANITHIPYRSGSAAMTDLFGGSLDFMFEPMYSALPAVRAGRVVALAITTPTRSPLLPAVPTMVEAGLSGFHMENWQGLIGPAGMPESIVNLLNATVNKALVDPTIKAQMLAQGNELGGGAPAHFAALVKAETERWGKVVRANGIVPE